MGREVRRVPANWQHPKDKYTGRYKPLSDGYSEAKKDFLDKLNLEGLQAAIDWCGCPDQNDYMPEWEESERTHLMMYESCSEGTPISPAFDTPEELARWLTDNNASAFGSQGASYEGWLRVARGGFACSMVYSPSTGCVSGVDGFTEDKT